MEPTATVPEIDGSTVLIGGPLPSATLLDARPVIGSMANASAPTSAAPALVILPPITHAY